MINYIIFGVIVVFVFWLGTLWKQYCIDIEREQEAKLRDARRQSDLLWDLNDKYDLLDKQVIGLQRSVQQLYAERDVAQTVEEGSNG